MACVPDFESDDDDDHFSDDGDYYDFQERIKKLKSNSNLSNDGKKNNEKIQGDIQKKSFFYALCNGDLKTVRESLNNGVDVNTSLDGGWIPILLACSVGHDLVTQELISRGADVNSSREGCTALMMACNCPNTTADYTKSFSVVKQLVEKGAKVKVVNRKRMTALMFAANVGNLAAVKYLLPLCDIESEDNQKWTALFWAVNGDQPKIVQYLLEEGANYTKVDVRNNTPLDTAKHFGFQDIINLFPKDDTDFIANIVDEYTHSFEETFSKLNKSDRPKFYLDICNMLCGLRSESSFKMLLDNHVGLKEFLYATDANLKEIGISLPYQRYRILSGVHRFHKHLFQPKSVWVVPLTDVYSNIDVAIQILTLVKQITCMESSIKYILINNTELSDLHDIKDLSRSVNALKSKLSVMKIQTRKIMKKTKYWDSYAQPADFIDSKSRSRKIPWNKIFISIPVISVFMYYIVKNKFSYS